jgi:hypothetical protein
MLPTSTLPVSPFMGSSDMGLLVGMLAIGGLLALVVGYAVHRREQRRAPRTTSSTAWTRRPSAASARERRDHVLAE